MHLPKKKIINNSKSKYTNGNNGFLCDYLPVYRVCNAIWEFDKNKLF